MRRTIPLLLVPLLLLAGCASASPDDAYLSTVKSAAPQLAGTDADDDALIDLGKKMCGMFDQYGYDKAYSQIVATADDGEAAKTVARAAVTSYCPKYADNL